MEMGVFANPTSKASPAKLRVAFEVQRHDVHMNTIPRVPRVL
jgi:hypothetical protein